MTGRRGYRVGPRRRCPLPPGALREGPGWATFWLNNCQNSLKTRLKYIQISLKVDFYEKKYIWPWPSKNLFRRGARRFFALRARIHKNTDYFRLFLAQIYQTLIFWPTPEKSCIRA